MLHRVILKVTKFQLPPPKRLNTVVKNILGACQIGLKRLILTLRQALIFCLSHTFLILAKDVKLIESKNYPGYFIATEETFGQIEEGFHNILKITIPGNTGQNNSISFQASDGTWLMENNSYIETVHYRNTLNFKHSTAFIFSDNKCFPGYRTFESSLKMGYF